MSDAGTRTSFHSYADESSAVAPEVHALLGALIEWSSVNLLAVDAEDESHAQEIADFLRGRQGLGQLLYETGRSSPSADAVGECAVAALGDEVAHDVED